MTIAEQIVRAKADLDNVYDIGYQEGRVFGWNLGIEDGIERGKQKGIGNALDIIQNYGTRKDYGSAFAYAPWTDDTFLINYDIKPVGSAGNMLRYTKITDLEAVLERQGVVLDTSETTNLNNAFNSTSLTVLPAIDLTGLNRVESNSNMVIQANTHTIRKLICKEETLWSPACFQYATGLINLEIEGVIGSEFNVEKCESLSKVSITSIVNALSVNTGGFTAKFSLSAVNKAFETSEGANDGSTSAEWAALKATKSNWEIKTA